MASPFSTEPEALAIQPPIDRPFIDVAHVVDKWFGVRVLKRRKDGTVTRRWWVRYTDGGGRPQRSMVALAERGTMRGSLKVAIEKKEEAEGLRRQKAGSMPTFREGWRQYWADNDPIGYALYMKIKPPPLTDRTPVWSADTRKGYLKSMARMSLWEDTKIDRISEDHAELMFNTIAHGVSSANMKRRRPIENRDGFPAAAATLRLARAIFQSYVRTGKIKINPCARLTNKKLLDPNKRQRRTSKVPSHKLPILWQWLWTESPAGVRDYVLVGIVMAFRKSVLNQLSWNMVDMETRTIIVPDQMRGNKAKLTFRLPIPDYIFERVILPRFNSHTKDPRWVLPSVRFAGQPVRSIKGSLGRLQAETGITFTLHDLRRTCVSLFKTVLGSELRSGRHGEEIDNALLCKRLLGHSNYATTAQEQATAELYIVFEDTEMRDAMNRVMERFLKLCDIATYHAWVNRGTLDADGRFVPPAPKTILGTGSDAIVVPDWSLAE